MGSIEMIEFMIKWLGHLFAILMPTLKAAQPAGDPSVARRSADGSEKKRIAIGVRRFFEQNYELRYNVLKQTEEFRPLRQKAPSISQKAPSILQKAPSNSQEAVSIAEETPSDWQQLTDRELRRIAIEQMEQVGVAWSIDVELYVHSSLVPNYNPVTDYLAHCPRWDGHDRIGELARSVPTDYDRWPYFFHRWMLAMVAQWQNRSSEYGNSVVPMLVGGQGARKSTFCRRLLPPELREYYIDDVKLDSAEQVERMLCRMLLVNIDEYNAKTDREQAKIKRLLTEKGVQTRKMRSDQYELRQRMASFIATTNETEPLSDSTGSRRYLCCLVEGVINTSLLIDHRQLYAQAQEELRRGAAWHFTKADEQEMERHNQDFRIRTSPEIVVNTWFELAEPSPDNFMSTVDILAILRQRLRPSDVPSIRVLAMTLKACGFARGRLKSLRGWYVRCREATAQA